MLAYRLALATATCTFILLLAGGLVHATDSGLACPDWPTCYGSLMPEMTGGVAIEHSHRLIATFVGLLTIGLAVSIHLTRKDSPSLVRMGWAALALVIFQGLLGGMTVIFELPTVVSSAHLATSMIYFSLIITLAYRLRGGRPSGSPSGSPATQASAPAGRDPGPLPARRWALFAVVAVYLQIVLGAVVRHTNVGLACTDIPLCKDALWLIGADPRVQLHMAHRVGAVVVALLVLAAAIKVVRAGTADGLTRFLAVTLTALVGVQIGLGLVSVYSALEVFTVTAHLGAGALLLGGALLLWLHQGSVEAPA